MKIVQIRNLHVLAHVACQVFRDDRNESISVPCDLHTTPTIDWHVDTGDEAGLLTAEVKAGIRNVLWAARPSKWNSSDESSPVLFIVLFAQEGGAPASSQLGKRWSCDARNLQSRTLRKYRADRVEPDALWSVLHGHRSGCEDYRGLGGIVPGETRSWSDTRGRGDADKRALDLVLHEVWQDDVGGQIDRPDIDVEYEVEVFVRHGFSRLEPFVSFLRLPIEVPHTLLG